MYFIKETASSVAAEHVAWRCVVKHHLFLSISARLSKMLAFQSTSKGKATPTDNLSKIWQDYTTKGAFTFDSFPPLYVLALVD